MRVVDLLVVVWLLFLLSLSDCCGCFCLIILGLVVVVIIVVVTCVSLMLLLLFLLLVSGCCCHLVVIWLLLFFLQLSLSLFAKKNLAPYRIGKRPHKQNRAKICQMMK